MTRKERIHKKNVRRDLKEIDRTFRKLNPAREFQTSPWTGTAVFGYVGRLSRSFIQIRIEN